jgi:hypothetical protein
MLKPMIVPAEKRVSFSAKKFNCDPPHSTPQQKRKEKWGFMKILAKRGNSGLSRYSRRKRFYRKLK